MATNDKEVKKLVDLGYSLDSKVKSLETKLKGVKAQLREAAEARKDGVLLGVKHFCLVGPQTTTACDPRNLYDTLKELGREDEFWDLVSVLITDTRSALGEVVFGDISATSTENYKKVSFKEKAPKKYIE